LFGIFLLVHPGFDMNTWGSNDMSFDSMGFDTSGYGGGFDSAFSYDSSGYY
jgi:hypothetical protein